MFRSRSYLGIGIGIVVTGIATMTACGGAEFGTADPGLDLDGSADTKPPLTGGTSNGGSGGASGSAGSGGTSGTGGAAGKGGGTGASGGAAGTGGAGGSGGTAGTAGTGGAGGSTDVDAGSNDVGNGSDSAGGDVSNDMGVPDASDGGARDGHAGDVAADRSTDADASTSDVPTSDAKDAADADSDSRSDAPSADSCQPIAYYKDEDSDGFGKTTETVLACFPPPGKWSVLSGDCRDDLPNVKPYSMGSPDPPQYSGTGYSDNGKPQGISFDYDCTGAEEADPTNSYPAEPDCPNILNCSGVGYIAVNPPRTGAGINPRCGSVTLKRCQVLLAEGAPALCNVTMEATTIPYRCR